MKTNARNLARIEVVHRDGRCYLSVRWEDADFLHETLRKGGCPTTVCLNPETRAARLELWPGVTADAVRAVLAGLAVPAGPVQPAEDRKSDLAADSAADLICI